MDGKKAGRPKKGDPRSFQYRVRLNVREWEMLQYLKEKGVVISDVIREALYAKFTPPIMERRYNAMDYFLAKNNKQLGICLRMLFAEDIQGTVKTVMNGKDRIEFHIYANVDEQMMKTLLDRYRILIS